MYFTDELYRFLDELKDNNDREWFNANKKRYEQHVKEPALRFVQDFGLRLQEITPHVLAIPRASGGSLFRIYRDTRFSKDKTPYKTHTGIQFRHAAGKDAHAPGFYLHLAPDDVGMAAGIWHPDTKTLTRIRDAIVDDPDGWAGLKAEVTSVAGFDFFGESLKRPPRGYDKDFVHIEDLKRKDVGVWTKVDPADTTADDFLDRFTDLCRAAAPVNAFVCKAIGQPW
jgi:uncharacterized protein (TIGR02453 family)